MHLPDMSKRLIPFPFVLVAITGTFILVALYADVRGRERRAEITNVNTPIVGVDNYQPPPETTATSTPEEGVENLPDRQAGAPLQQTPEPLGLSPETPTSDIPAVAVFDCWRYEFHGDRLIVDRDYRHIAGDSIEPMVGSDTVHLRCKMPQYALRSDDGSVMVYWSGSVDRATYETGRTSLIDDNRLYRVDAQTGYVTTIAQLEGLDEQTDYALVAFTPDTSAVWLRADSSKNGVSTLYEIPLTQGAQIRSYTYPQVQSAFFLTPDQSRAIGFEYTFRGDLEGGPVYLHRVNLATDARVRTKPITSVFDRVIPETNWQPVFIDNERLIMPGAPDAGGTARGATMVNVFTGATTRVPQITGTAELLALTQDGTTLYTLSDSMPLTAIPVAELPKP
ncbi:MAG: hypothetical protein AAB974_00490 [Patescibacteria group bacterium]